MNILKTVILMTAAALFFVACGEQKVAEQPHEFLRITQKTSEVFDTADVQGEIIEYTYEKEDDMFWSKAVHKDTAGNVIITVTRELDENRLPVKEIHTDELGMSTEQYKLEYSPKNFELLMKEEYEGEIADKNKVETVKYAYDDNGYLLSKEIIKYDTDTNYVNADGNNVDYHYIYRFIIPSANRPKGNHEVMPYLEKARIYLTPKKAKAMELAEEHIGKLMAWYETQFDENNLPVHYKSFEAEFLPKDDHGHHTDEEWYIVEKDTAGKVMSISSYYDEAKTLASFSNHRHEFTYHDNGMIASFKEFKYDTTNNTYSLMHAYQQYAWVDSPVMCAKDFTEMNLVSESICYHRKQHSFNETKVEKYDGSEKVVVKYSAAYTQGEAPEKPELKMDKKITCKFEKITAKK